MSKKYNCDLCGKLFEAHIYRSIYVLESPRRNDVEMCGKCADSVWKKAIGLINL